MKVLDCPDIIYFAAIAVNLISGGSEDYEHEEKET